MRLKRAKARAFRSFYDEQTTPDLPEKGLFLVDGMNKDTGGGSNSGKSNLTLMVAYALDFCPYPATILQNWDTASKMQNVLELDTANGPLTLSRGEHTYVEYKGVKTSGAKAYKEKLQEIFKLSPDMLEALTYRRQGQQGGIFLSMDDAHKKSFLSELLGLTKIEKAIEVSKLQIVGLEVLLKVKQGVLDNLPSIVEPVLDIPVNNIEELQGKHKSDTWLMAQTRIKQVATEKEILELKKEITKLEGELTWFLKDVSSDFANSKGLASLKTKLGDFYNNEQLNALKHAASIAYSELNKHLLGQVSMSSNQKRIKFLEGDIVQERYEADKITGLGTDLDKATQDLNSLMGQKCYVCEGPRVRDPVLLRQAEDRAATAQARLDAALLRRSTLPQTIHRIGCEIAELVDTVAKFDNETKRLQSIYSKCLGDIKEYESSIGKNQAILVLEIQTLEAKITLDRQNAASGLRHNIDSSKGKLHNLEFARMDHINKQRELASGISSIENDIKLYELIDKQARTEYNIRLREYQKNYVRHQQLNSEISSTLESINLEKDLIIALGKEGFLGSIFEEILGDISSRTNDYLKMVPNVATITLSLDTEKETKTGSMSKKITPVVYKSGKAIPLTGGISGGMVAVVALAVDLALLSIIQERTGLELGWLILDEAMDGLGSLEKEACFELLRQVAHNKLILIIEHDDKAKTFCDGSIRVVTENERTTIDTTIY